MARKGGRIIVIMIGIVFLIAIATNVSFTQKDADIYTRKFRFLGVFDSIQVKVPTVEELDTEMEAASIIAVVKPMDEVEVYAYNVLQKVEIIKILKGNESAKKQIWISTTNGIYENENWGITNLMYPEYEYFVVLNEIDGRYYNDFFMGAIRLEKKMSWNVLDLSKEYTYAELKDERYFAVDRQTLEMLYQREKYILEKWKLSI